MEGQIGIFQLITNHFNQVYASDNPSLEEECIQSVTCKVSIQMNEALNQPISDFEIKTAVDSIGDLKALGPDGLNGLFFQKNWDTIGSSVCRAVMLFFDTGQLPSDLNETVVTLIPKVPMPDCLNQLRPISCCNYIYKVISKIVVMRMRGYMGNLVSYNQSAFVGGRLIQDNLIIAYEAFHALKQKARGGRENMAIKLDMSKAYDRVEWNFIEKVLLAYGFEVSWVKP